MDLHSEDKGIIHTTSYTQVRFIESSPLAGRIGEG